MATNPQENTNSSGVVWYSRLSDSLSAVGRHFKQLVLYSSAYLAVIAFLEVAIVTELLSLRWTAAPVVAALLSFAVYGNDRVADVEIDSKTAPERAAFVDRHRQLLYALSALAYGLAVALAVLGGPVAFALALVPGIVWVCYAKELMPGGVGIDRLKQVFLLNTGLVAGAWGLVVVCLPVAFAGAAVTPTTALVFLIFSLAVVVDVEIPNVRDREGDREAGIKTLPVILGVRGTRYALYGVTAVAGGLVAFGFVEGLFTALEAGLLLVSLLYLAVVVTAIEPAADNGRLSIAAECSRLPVLLVMVPGAL